LYLDFLEHDESKKKYFYEAYDEAGQKQILEKLKGLIVIFKIIIIFRKQLTLTRL
jgi:hypothetical protein